MAVTVPSTILYGLREVLGGCFMLIVTFYLGLWLATYWRRLQLCSQHGCKPPARYPVWDPFLGIDVIYDAIRAVNRKTFMSEKRSHYEKYGNTHSSSLITLTTINTIEPENIKTVLSTNFKDFVIGTPRRRVLRPIVANSILVADGEEWEHSRAFLKPSFSRSQVSDLATLEVHIKNLLEAIPRDGSTVDLAELFLRYTADVTTDFMFGESILSLPQPDASGGELTKACRVAQLRAERRFYLGILAHVAPQRQFYRSVQQLHTYIDAHVEKTLQQRDIQKRLEKTESQGSNRFVFSQELVKLSNDRIILRDQLLGIFFAGRDTTAALLSNLFFVCARNPEVWKRLHAEISFIQGRMRARVLGNALGALGPLHKDELSGFKYLSSCLNETLRLYPIVMDTFRVAVNDVILPVSGGEDRRSPVFIAKGSMVISHLFALHKWKDLWGEDADEFRPERWQNEKTSWKFLPFLGGPRNCIGQQFALTEASYTTVRLIQEFLGIESRDPEPWTESIGVSCSSANGVKVAMMS